MTPTPKERLIQIAEQQLPALKKELLDIADALDHEIPYSWIHQHPTLAALSAPRPCAHCANTISGYTNVSGWFCGQCGCYNSVR